MEESGTGNWITYCTAARAKKTGSQRSCAIGPVYSESGHYLGMCDRYIITKIYDLCNAKFCSNYENSRFFNNNYLVPYARLCDSRFSLMLCSVLAI